jgi:hypothetical protein
MFPFIMQGSNITVVIDSNSHTISKTHITYEKVKEAIKSGDWETVRDIIEPKKAMINYGLGNVSIQGDTLYWKNEVFHNVMASRMIEMIQEGFSIEPLVLFMENLMQNPSHRSVTELYGFLEKNNLPITPDGHFLAYKKVRQNYMDVHSGTFDNSVGKVCEMPRNKVDDVAENTCSSGLHFCSQDYLNHFGGDRVVIVKINPRDVVSIPTDYDFSKGRTCRYEVVGEVGASKADTDEAFTAPVQSNATNNIAKPVVPVAPVVAQEYDSRGRPLSMTPNAISKRRARDAAKTVGAVGSSVVAKPAVGATAQTFNAAWPMPKRS